jgi:hypothetical protein
MNALVIDQRLRRLLLALAGFVFLATPVELWLVEHTESLTQYIPFVLCGLGVVAVVGVLLSPQRITLWFLRGVMLLVLAGSLFGMVEHLEGNIGFELEIRPNATTSDVLMDALRGGNPILAPGMLVVGALIALIATYYHPGFLRVELPLLDPRPTASDSRYAGKGAAD